PSGARRRRRMYAAGRHEPGRRGDGRRRGAVTRWGEVWEVALAARGGSGVVSGGRGDGTAQRGEPLSYQRARLAHVHGKPRRLRRSGRLTDSMQGPLPGTSGG